MFDRRSAGGMAKGDGRATKGTTIGWFRRTGDGMGSRNDENCRGTAGTQARRLGGNARQDLLDLFDNGTRARLRRLVGRNIRHPDAEEDQEQREKYCCDTPGEMPAREVR